MVGIYYELHDLFKDVKECKNIFKDINPFLTITIKAGFKKHIKYYEYIDLKNIYYLIIILDPRFKFELLKLKMKLEDVTFLISKLKSYLHYKYPTMSTPNLYIIKLYKELNSLES